MQDRHEFLGDQDIIFTEEDSTLFIGNILKIKPENGRVLIESDNYLLDSSVEEIDEVITYLQLIADKARSFTSEEPKKEPVDLSSININKLAEELNLFRSKIINTEKHKLDHAELNDNGILMLDFKKFYIKDFESDESVSAHLLEKDKFYSIIECSTDLPYEGDIDFVGAFKLDKVKYINNSDNSITFILNDLSTTISFLQTDFLNI